MSTRITTASTMARRVHPKHGRLPATATRFTLPLLIGLALSACDKGDTDVATQTSESTLSSDGPSAESISATDGGTLTGDYPTGTCREILDAEMPGSQDSHPVDSFWFCPYTCGVAETNDTLDIALAKSRMSYDQLEPGQPDGCYELRTALYQCFDELTCAEVAAFREALDAGTDGPCVDERLALEPHIPECGI